MRKYIKHLVNLWGGVEKLSKESNRTSISLFVEFLYCYVRYGCLPRQFTVGGFWNKRFNDRCDILTYRRLVKTMNRLNSSQHIHYLENKAHFNTYFSEFVHREWLFSLNSTVEQIEKFLRKHNHVIIKPYEAMEGHGIYKLDVSNVSDLYYEAKKLKQTNVMIEEILVQNPLMNFGNASVNTIRVNTILDKQGKGHVLSCVLRAGVGNVVVDNYCSGGVVYPIDVNYGIVIGKGVSRLGSNHVVHPQTDTIMIGYKIPNWGKLISETIRAAELIPEIRLVGWDVAITSDGLELIEGNHNPDYELYEFVGDGKSYKQIKQYIN